MVEFFWGPLAILVISGLITFTYKHPAAGRKVANALLLVCDVGGGIVVLYFMGATDALQRTGDIDVPILSTPTITHINLSTKKDWSKTELDSIGDFYKKEELNAQLVDSIQKYQQIIKDSTRAILIERRKENNKYTLYSGGVVLIGFIFYLVTTWLSYVFENARKEDTKEQDDESPEEANQESA